MTGLTRRSVAIAAFVTICLGAAGASAQQVRIIERAMPAPMVEVVPAPPRVGMNWVRGHWVWRGGDWFWVKGHFVEVAVAPMPAPLVEVRPAPPAPNYFWVQGHHAWEGGGWRWHPGVWMRP
ncbi:MAG: hypothetical protein QM651_05320 [Rhodoblastus sp.]